VDFWFPLACVLLFYVTAEVEPDFIHHKRKPRIDSIAVNISERPVTEVKCLETLVYCDS
jgi:hypothetical protein